MPRWDAQRQYVGSLMTQPAGAAAALLALVPDDAIADPLTRWIYELIRAVVGEGRDPHPVCVLHRARSQPAAQALYPEDPPRPRDVHRLTMALTELYTGVIAADAIAECARDVLDEAYRSAYHRAGVRMAQLAETRTEVGELGVELAAVCTKLVDLRRRATACTAARQRR
jgi:hypothetical protein